jgi:FkbM family methyltransferase
MTQQSFLQNSIKGANGFIQKLFHNPYRQVNMSFAKVKILKHLKPGKLYHHNLFGRKFYFRNPQNFLEGIREIFIEQCYRQLLPTQPYILDCGANIGLSVLYMKRLFPDALIDAFEPDESNFEVLQMNVQSFGLKNVSLYKKAVWIKDETLLFRSRGTMGSGIVTEKNNETIEVKAVRLSNYMTRKIDFLKMDIEGAEYSVLKDIEPQLHLVSNLFVEYHGLFEQNDELLEMLQLIRKNGFTIYIEDSARIYHQPFLQQKSGNWGFDVQLNIYCRK